MQALSSYQAGLADRDLASVVGTESSYDKKQIDALDEFKGSWTWGNQKLFFDGVWFDCTDNNIATRLLSGTRWAVIVTQKQSHPVISPPPEKPVRQVDAC